MAAILKNWDTNAEEALQHVIARYKSLSVYGTELAQLSRESGGIPLPLDILSAYNEAANDYFDFATRVFDLLKKNGMAIEQVVYRAGAPDLGPDGNVRTVRIDMPLQVPFLPHRPGATERVGQIAAPAKSEMGIAPALIAGYAIMGAVIVVGIAVAGYFSKEILREVRMFFQDGPDYEPDKHIDAYLKCTEQAKKLGYSPAEIIQSGCQELLKAPPARGTRWGMILLGIAAIGGAVYILPKVTK